MLDWLFSFGLFALVMSATPGPNNVLVASSGANFGYRRTLPHILGICMGFPFMLAACWVGVAALLELFPGFYTVIQIGGITYLLYLAWKIARSDGTAKGGGDSHRPMSVLEGALFQWINPKAWVIALGALTAYARHDMDSLPQILWMSGIFMFVCFLSVSVWTLAGAGVGTWVGGGRGMKIFNRVMAVLLVASLIVGFWPE